MICVIDAHYYITCTKPHSLSILSGSWGLQVVFALLAHMFLSLSLDAPVFHDSISHLWTGFFLLSGATLWHLEKAHRVFSPPFARKL